MNRNKLWTLIPAALIMVAALAGCARNNPATTPTVLPEATAMMTNPVGTPETSPEASPAGTQMAGPVDWTRDFAAVEGRLNMISEIETSTVLVSGDMALVGVTFTSAYQGEMTDRIQGMVAAEVMAADTAVTTVGVTSDPNDVAKITELANQVRAGSPPDDLPQQMTTILNNPTTMK